MLKLEIVGGEFFDEEKQEFFNKPSTFIELEHSLVSLSLCESKWEKPFLSDDPKTTEETLSYVECMIIGDIPEGILKKFDASLIEKVNHYIARKMTATWFSDDKKSIGFREVITAELIYYWMVSFNIPFECQHWHLKRLLTLIQVCSRKNQPEKKMSKADLMERNRKLNAMRKAQYNTTG